MKSLPKDGRVGIGETAKGTGTERTKNVPKAELLGKAKSSENAAVSSKIVPLKARSWDVDVAFKEVTRLVRSGVVRPSKYGLQKWTTEEFSCLPSKKDIADWQTKWFKQGLIEPADTVNGKQTYKLKVKKEATNHAT